MYQIIVLLYRHNRMIQMKYYTEFITETNGKCNQIIFGT